MFITPALAQQPGASGGGAIIQLIPFIAIFAIMYFLIIRPQQKRLQQHRDMVAVVSRGDVVVTAGGMIGKIVKLVGDEEVLVEVADGVQVKIVRHTISEVRAKGKPVRDSN